MKSRRSVIQFDLALMVLAVYLLSSGGCAFLQRNFGRDQEQTLPRREPSPGAKEQKLEIPRASYKAALEQPGSGNKVRLVQVFSGGKDPSSEEPQWRIFDVRRGGVCDLLGLKNGDVILAANSRMFLNPAKFAAYLALLAGEKQASIQLKREGQEHLMNYVFLDPGGEQNIP